MPVIVKLLLTVLYYTLDHGNIDIDVDVGMLGNAAVKPTMSIPIQVLIKWEGKGIGRRIRP